MIDHFSSALPSPSNFGRIPLFMIHFVIADQFIDKVKLSSSNLLGRRDNAAKTATSKGSFP